MVNSLSKRIVPFLMILIGLCLGVTATAPFSYAIMDEEFSQYNIYTFAKEAEELKKIAREDPEEFRKKLRERRERVRKVTEAMGKLRIEDPRRFREEVEKSVKEHTWAMIRFSNNEPDLFYKLMYDRFKLWEQRIKNVQQTNPEDAQKSRTNMGYQISHLKRRFPEVYHELNRRYPDLDLESFLS